MSCYHPLRGIVLGVNAGTGKKNVRIVKSDFLSPEVEDVEYVKIPCGHCIGCFLDRSRQWADRCMLELKYHEKACFLTLTYDDAHLPPPNDFYDKLTGECYRGIIHPLNKKHLQKFVKDLRSKLVYDYKRDNPHWIEKNLPRVRFFACGEYGEHSLRPHYHMILFGEDFRNDRTFYKFNGKRQPLYNSALLSSLWPYGFSVIGDVNWDTCAYVARYVTKKIKGSDNNFYDNFNVPPEFTNMSRRPGIGRQYYDEHKYYMYSVDEIYLPSQDGYKSLRPCKYYDRLYDIDAPDAMSDIKEMRKVAMENALKIKAELTDKNYLDMLLAEESYKIAQTKILKRKEI